MLATWLFWFKLSGEGKCLSSLLCLWYASKNSSLCTKFLLFLELTLEPWSLFLWEEFWGSFFISLFSKVLLLSPTNWKYTSTIFGSVLSFWFWELWISLKLGSWLFWITWLAWTIWFTWSDWFEAFWFSWFVFWFLIILSIINYCV